MTLQPDELVEKMAVELPVGFSAVRVERMLRTVLEAIERGEVVVPHIDITYKGWVMKEEIRGKCILAPEFKKWMDHGK